MYLWNYVKGIREMSIPAFANGGMNVTGLQLVDVGDSSVRSYLKTMALRRNTRAPITSGNPNSPQCKVGNQANVNVILKKKTLWT
jgi:hypothetical protein